MYCGVGGRTVEVTVLLATGGKYGTPGFKPTAPGLYIPEELLPEEKESLSTKFVCVFFVPDTRMSFSAP